MEEGRYYNKLVLLVKTKIIHFDLDKYSQQRNSPQNIGAVLNDKDFEKVSGVKTLVTISPDTFNIAFGVLNDTETELRGYSGNSVIRLAMPFEMFLEIWNKYFNHSVPIIDIIQTIDQRTKKVETFTDKEPNITPLYLGQYTINRKDAQNN